MQGLKDEGLGFWHNFWSRFMKSEQATTTAHLGQTGDLYDLFLLHDLNLSGQRQIPDLV